ncbi:MAG TPA: hypothetical protein VGG61_05870 [Gemmataceae bacterium]
MELDRRDLARFRAAIRRCVGGRPRGLAPPVTLQQTKGSLTLSVVLQETALALRLPGAGGPTARLVVPSSTLAAIVGPGGGIVSFEPIETGGVRCRWQDRGEAKELESVPSEGQTALPPLGKLQDVDASLLTALHACGQTANREQTGRPALTRLQLRGQAGEIAGTDGRQLLLWGGFALPFREDLLVPAVPIFGGRELAGEQDVRIGRTAKHVAVAAGPWTVWLAVDAESKYPDVIAVIPSSFGKLVIDDVDAAALLQELQRRPPSGGAVVPVALDLGLRAAVRWPEETSRRKKPLILSRSTFSGPATVIKIDPQYVIRALALRFRELHSSSGDLPVWFRDEHRRYVVANIGPAPARAAASADTTALSAQRPASPSPEHGEESMNTDRNGGPPAEHLQADDVLDPLTEAEALRVALTEVARRSGRLIASLRRFQKQRRALHSAWTSLKDLRLGPRE